MWIPEHPRAADRGGLRYPSDLTDAEWALIELMIPPARHGGRKRSINIREVLNAIFYLLWTGCQWKALPRDLPRRAPRIITSCCGTGTVGWSASIMHFTSRRASRLDAKGALRRQSSTARVVKPLKKGLCTRPAGLRCGQEGHGTQAPYPRRYARPVAERCRSSRQHSRSRRRRIGAQPAHPPSVPLHRMHFCRGGNQGPKATAAAARTGTWKIQIVKRPDTAIGFQVVPKRWIIEQTPPGSVASVVLLEILSATPEPSQPPRYGPHHVTTFDQMTRSNLCR